MESPTRLLISNGLTLAIPATMMMQPARGEAVRPNCPATAHSSPRASGFIPKLAADGVTA